jgi:hypothetical protein
MLPNLASTIPPPSCTVPLICDSLYVYLLDKIDLYSIIGYIICHRFQGDVSLTAYS